MADPVTTPPVDFAMLLRRLGETIDGRRDESLMLVKFQDTGMLGVLKQDTRSERAFDVLWRSPEIDLSDPHRTVPFVKIENIKIAYGENQFALVPKKADALFLTDSALEKFVYPYYEQVRIRDESYLENLKSDIRTPERRQYIIAVEHDNPSHSEALIVGGPTGPTPSARYLVADEELISHAKNHDAEHVHVESPAAGGAPYAWLTPKQFSVAYHKKTGGGPAN